MSSIIHNCLETLNYVVYIKTRVKFRLSLKNSIMKMRATRKERVDSMALRTEDTSGDGLTRRFQTRVY